MKTVFNYFDVDNTFSDIHYEMHGAPQLSITRVLGNQISFPDPPQT